MVTAKVAWVAEAEIRLGMVRVVVDSSGRSRATVPSAPSLVVALTVPTQPALPVPQVTWIPTRPSPSGATAELVTVSREGKVTPVALVSPCGSKQPSNSNAGLVTSRPWVSVRVRKPVSLVGPAAV
ncbi:unannotated protein [freshwater metagenome]|uniref:Unannotated protein n=1 Tax=freshwater metagenome TaxID=449393 RepID=A0A6J6NGT5_9ZZZZ